VCRTELLRQSGGGRFGLAKAGGEGVALGAEGVGLLAPPVGLALEGAALLFGSQPRRVELFLPRLPVGRRPRLTLRQRCSRLGLALLPFALRLGGPVARLRQPFPLVAEGLAAACLPFLPRPLSLGTQLLALVLQLAERGDVSLFGLVQRGLQLRDPGAHVVR